MGRNTQVGLVALAASFSVVGATEAAFVVFKTANYTDGLHSGMVTFALDTSGGSGNEQLEVVATSTMTSITSSDGSAWLTGVFWSLAGADATYNSMSATVNFVDSAGTISAPNNADPEHYWGSTELVGGWSTDIGGVDFSGLFGGGLQTDALTAAGFGLSGQSEDNTNLDGSDGGLLPSGVSLADLNNGHDDQDFVIGSLTAIYDLTGYDVDLFGVGDDVAIVFGTAFSEVVLIPLPLALPMGLAGLAGVVVIRRRATREKQAA